MAGYIEISSDGGSNYKKVRVRISDKTVDGVTLTPSDTFASLNGSTTISVGAGKRRWSYRALVQYSSPPTGYADYAFITALFSAATIAASKLKLKGMVNTTAADVFLTNRSDPGMTLLTFDPSSSTSFYEFDLEFAEQ